MRIPFGAIRGGIATPIWHPVEQKLYVACGDKLYSETNFAKNDFAVAYDFEQPGWIIQPYGGSLVTKNGTLLITAGDPAAWHLCKIYRSNGTNWTAFTPVLEAGALNMRYAEDIANGIIILGGRGGAKNATVQLSNDDGQTWTQKADFSETIDHFHGIGYDPKVHLWVGVTGDNDGKRRVIYSRDAFTTYTDVAAPFDGRCGCAVPLGVVGGVVDQYYRSTWFFGNDGLCPGEVNVVSVDYDKVAMQYGINVPGFGENYTFDLVRDANLCATITANGWLLFSFDGFRSCHKMWTGLTSYGGNSSYMPAIEIGGDYIYAADAFELIRIPKSVLYNFGAQPTSQRYTIFPSKNYSTNETVLPYNLYTGMWSKLRLQVAGTNPNRVRVNYFTHNTFTWGTNDLGSENVYAVKGAKRIIRDLQPAEYMTFEALGASYPGTYEVQLLANK